MNVDPIEFNNEQKKRLGEAIHHSFLHPKAFKIGKLSLTKTAPKKTSPSIKTEKNMSDKKNIKEAKHKFNII